LSGDAQRAGVAEEDEAEEGPEVTYLAKEAMARKQYLAGVVIE
jgi:hypothetical protein